jgi:hypothetical protein
MDPRTRKVVIGVAVAAATVVVLAAAAFYWVGGLRDAAESGKQQAEAGARSLASQDATSAALHFAAASRSFTRAQSMLGPEWVGRIANIYPKAGRQYAAARALVAIGSDVSIAGSEFAAALRETPETSATTGSGRFGAMLSSGQAHIDRALVALVDIVDRSAGLSESGLIAPLAGAVRSVKSALSQAGPFLGRIRATLALERYLLSADRRILVAAQNNAELRPTGGFVGSYGIVDVGPAGLELEKYADVYTLPDVRGSLPKPHGNHFPKFAFRDANWWLDFPTSARAMLTFWREYRQPRVDGIVAVDTVAMRDLLGVLGPVRVPSYAETFTADNLLTRLVYLIEVKSGGGDGKKAVLVDLANELEKRLLDSSPSELAAAARVLAQAADEKHVQMYFTDPKAQAAVVALGWSGAISPPRGTTDLLAVSNTMNYAGKSNMGMRKSLDYSVALRPNGSADTTLVLRYANTGSWAVPPGIRSAFRNYLRVQGMPGTVFRPDPENPGGSTMMAEGGLPTVAREFSVQRGRSRTERVFARIPSAWGAVDASVAVAATGEAETSGPAASAASKSASRYRLLIVAQADLEDVKTKVSVAPPQGWRISGARAWKRTSGERLAVSFDGPRALMALPLAGDVIMEVDLRER